MGENINQKEIDELLKQIELSFKIPSVIDITPIEISHIRDDATRKSIERKFYLVNELFVVPLQKLLNKSINSVNYKGEYSCDYSQYSLKQRIHLISKELLIMGYDPTYLSTLLPHTVEEVNKKIKEIEEHKTFQVIDAKNKNASHRRIA